MCKYYNLIIPLILFFLSSCGETEFTEVPSTSSLEQAFEIYKEAAFEKRRFFHADIIPLLEKHAQSFKMDTLGRSVKGREIFQLSYGSGPTKVLLWSQMHGNESTATMALFDLFNFLDGEDSTFMALRELMEERLSIRVIPMVNPDGAEQFMRRNALGIDLNRDARRTTSIEAEILKNARDDFSPHFGFNLHDQSTYYNTLGSRNPATISVLAPAYNKEREMNEVRLKAMKVIAGMNRVLQEIVPQHVGKYNDTFEPRAFGDNFQKWGTSTILIESGGYPNDPEKQYIRKLNFMAILGALYEIASEGYERYKEEDYFSIPDNESRLMDVLIKNATVDQEGVEYTTDIGIRRGEHTVGKDYFVRGNIQDWGDLSTFFGYVELEAKGLRVQEGKVYEGEVNHDEYSVSDAWKMLKEGYMWVKSPEDWKGRLHNLPIMMLSAKENTDSEIGMGSSANFYLEGEDGLKYAVLNGYLLELEGDFSGEELKNKY
ncbi:M14 family metallopeptidase [Pleomorphovibrio marinus]|uniref:M14 family metallopeptidase n=1 Tax=Pleomorphovibrio marinus TaxID=2164132 RepID=UPI000E0C6C44|nr:M14 metallopeptidase family protein [Pleomorphovibrio marinus]